MGKIPYDIHALPRKSERKGYVKASMKVKYSLIPFIPAALAMIALRFLSIFSADESGNFLGLDKMAMSYTVIGIGLALFVICVLINIFDRKTSPVYPLKKNYFAGVFAVLSGITVLASSIMPVLQNGLLMSEYFVIEVITVIFAVPAAIAFVFMSRAHFSGKTTVSNVSILYIFPALWGCTRLVQEFLNATKVSITSVDMSALFGYIFMTLYLFSQAMVLSRIKGRNPVKACFIYGLPAAALLLSYGAYSSYVALNESMGIQAVFASVQLIVIGIYALSFIVELFANSYTKDELQILEELPEEGEEEQYDTAGYDDLVAAPSNDSALPNQEKRADSYFDTAGDIDDFIIGYRVDDEDNEPIPYLTKNEKKNGVDTDLVIPGLNTDNSDSSADEAEAAGAAPEKEEKSEKAKEEKSAPASAEKPEPKLSDIDLLLQELDSKK